MGGAGQGAGMGFGDRRISTRHDQGREPAERREPGSLAEGNFLGIELLRSPQSSALHDWVFGLIGLNEGGARLVAASRSPRHLRNQLERALSSAWIAAAQPEIGIDHAD